MTDSCDKSTNQPLEVTQSLKTTGSEGQGFKSCSGKIFPLKLRNCVPDFVFVTNKIGYLMGDDMFYH